MAQINIEEALLECAVCLKTLDETCKMLPCQHTFCKKCLQKIYKINRRLNCPQCRMVVKTEIDHLPPNYFLLNIIEKIKVVKSETKEDELFKEQILNQICHLNINETSEDSCFHLQQLTSNVVDIVTVVSNKKLFNSLELKELEKYNGILDNYLKLLFKYNWKICSSNDEEPSDFIADNESSSTMTVSSPTIPGDDNDVVIVDDIHTNVSNETTIISDEEFEVSDEESEASDKEYHPYLSDLLQPWGQTREIIDSIDGHKKNIQILKEKIELRMALMMSEEKNN